MDKIFVVFRTTLGKKGGPDQCVMVQSFRTKNEAAAYLLGLWDSREGYKAHRKSCTYDGSRRPYLVELDKTKYTIGEYDAEFAAEFPLHWGKS